MTLAWVLAAIIGLLTSVFYVDQTMGVSVVILTVLTLYTMGQYRKEAGLPMGYRFYTVSGYMLVLSPVFAVTTVTIIRFWAGVILTLLFLTLAISQHKFTWPRWMEKSLIALFGALGKSVNFFSHGSKVTSNNRKILGQVLLGVVVAIPLLLVAAGLLASADVVMNEFMGDLFEAIEIENFGLWFWRVFVTVFVAALMYGYKVWMAGQESHLPIEAEVLSPRKMEVIPALVSGTVLVLLNFLYIVFAYIQIKFLFLGGQVTTIEGYNYAEYARSGFFELVALSVLNTIGILVINRFTKGHLFNHISLTVTATCTFIMMASSWYKMYLYESAYGYTQLRLYVYMILAFMCVFMALITLGIWQRHLPVVEWAILVGLVYFLIIAYVNVDAIIVDNNVARYEETGDIDMYYLLNDLSKDGTPKVIEFVESNMEVLASQGLRTRYQDMLSWYTDANIERKFFEYNLRFSGAVKGVKAVVDEP